MWIPKWRRDHRRSVDSPIPTQVCSNEEFIPRRQNTSQARVEALISELAEDRARKLGMDRRTFLRSSRGLATGFLASNLVYGSAGCWEVDEVETFEEQAIQERFPDDYFIMDVQAHFTNGLPLGFRSMEFVRNMGFELHEDADAYSFPNFIKEMFLDSDTDVLVISGVPGKEYDRRRDLPRSQRRGAPLLRRLEHEERTPGPEGSVLPSWLMANRRNEINRLAGSTRALCQGNCAPNHYWDHQRARPDWPKLLDQIEREVNVYGINSWKWYCHSDPARSGNGFRCDDEDLAYPFYESSKQLGIRIFSVHKGFSSQSLTLGHLAHPGDLEKAALDHPDLTFVVYHSAIRHGPDEIVDQSFDPETGDFEWHADLMRIKERNPHLDNLYPELGSAFNLLAIAHPEMCMHLIGKNIKYYGADHVLWGTDCLWWGSPQWAIEAFKRFQISDELCERFGYSKITGEDRRLIFGLNAARLYGIDPEARLYEVSRDGFERVSREYEAHGGRAQYASNAAHGWVWDDAHV
jgi:uncharacterized protein